RNCLVEISPTFEAVPELAESFESRNGPAEWVFRLRPGVRFHNGKALTAEDVIYSLNLHRGPDTKSGAKALLKGVAAIAKEDWRTVSFKLSSPNSDFPYVLADYHLVIVPEGTSDFAKGVGTGPYMLESFAPGVRALVKRNPNYWKADRGHFDTVETINIADA